MLADAQSFRRYCLAFVALAGGGVLLVAAFNYVVDPFGVFGTNTLGIYASADRESKPRAYTQGDYEAVLLGNSKAAMIPTSELAGPRFFSATFGGAMPEELFYFVDRHAEDAELAVVMLDFWSFRNDPPLCADPFGPPDFGQTLEYLLSRRALDEAFKTVRRHWQGERPAFAADGSFIAERWIASKSAPNELLAQVEFNEHTRWFADYTPSPERMHYLERLADTLAARGIPAIVVLAPMHAHSLELMRGTSAEAELPAWKARVRALFPRTVDLIDSEWSAPENFFPADPTHFRPEAGVSLLNEALAESAPGDSDSTRP